MSVKRILLIGAVVMLRGRVKESGLAMVEVCDRLEPVLAQIKFVANAPFKTVHLIINYGEKTDLKVKYQAINKRHEELPVTVDLEQAPLRMASREVVAKEIMNATIEVLLQVAEKYSLPSEGLRELRVH